MTFEDFIAILFFVVIPFIAIACYEEELSKKGGEDKWKNY